MASRGSKLIRQLCTPSQIKRCAEAFTVHHPQIHECFFFNGIHVLCSHHPCLSSILIRLLASVQRKQFNAKASQSGWKILHEGNEQNSFNVIDCSGLRSFLDCQPVHCRGLSQHRMVGDNLFTELSKTK